MTLTTSYEEAAADADLIIEAIAENPEQKIAFYTELAKYTIWQNNTAEVMGHPGTEQKYYDEVVQFAEDINMIPLKLNKEQPGYILNSLLVPFLNAAQSLLANDVSDHETIDKTWILATGAPAGPFHILDIVGLTTTYNIISMNPEAQNPETTPGKIAKMLKEKIDAAETGINAGKGFYEY